MQTPVKWWNKWWDHFFQPQKPMNREENPESTTPKQLPVFDLRIQLFGHVRCFASNREIPEMSSPQHTLLLAYFARHAGQKIRRDQLIGQFWPDVHQESARNSLNVALCHIRRHFRQYVRPQEQIIVHQRGCYRFNPNWIIQTDVQRFEQYLQQGQQLEKTLDTAGAFRAYRRAAQVYSGDLLSAFPYEEWTGTPREQLRQRYLQALEGLGICHLQRNESQAARATFQQMLQRDPYLERAHQLLMWCYAKEGQRDLAIRQYRKCQSLLLQEFGLEPSSQTQTLYHCIVSGEALQTAFLSRA
ncbi:AfsR/SARP family transcriptional regulator [Flavilitoribacter nigricans]|uniref:OmpR/PhoB-type domain-containing protein n=1 Tax=Flavilitoribacter nigricans (strain ATCC 23147 / DSM 23189 / NBRC 102662 / NCIMB 1420 / SS-2) TaxID=1122177 RepID=A0A2D0N6X7_FLAN2|nr:BTAD domain-containing putative transcriptional regulator [Flavilitoribacter nigricans]PHN04136.1 hypothetical protein CRP01_23350 [Flavilitoribacter nigricans DSM 23189 = NBRC 102662]